MTTSPPQPPQNPYPAQAGGYGPPQEQFPQYPQPQQGPSHGQPQYAHQQQFQQHAPHQFPQGQPGFAPMPQGALQCRFCGAFPAVDATVRGHQGLIVLMRFLKLQGPFCRTCGIATVRDMTAKSMWQGWWGIGSSIINPIMMLTNIGPMQKFKSLPEPAPGMPGRPMDPGKPLFRRPAILGLLLPFALIALIVLANLNSVSNAEVGQCVMNKGTAGSPDVKKVDCDSSDAEYRIVGKLDDTTDGDQCKQFADAETFYYYKYRSTEYTLCLARI